MPYPGSHQLHTQVPAVAHSGITVTATNKLYKGGGGLHVYISASDVDLLGLQRYLVVHLWIAGLGYIALARNGAMLERCIIDLSVLSPERLIYEAEPGTR